MSALRRIGKQAMAAAESLTGRRFALLVATSLVATTAIVATALSSARNNGPLAALLGQSLTADSAPAAPATTGSGGPSPVSPGSAGGGPGDQVSPAPAPLAAQQSPAPAPAAPESAARKTDATETPSAPQPSGPVGPIKHVFVISLASPGYEQSLGGASEMPYLSTLVPKGQLVPGYELLSADPLPNNVALLSGQRPNAATEGDCAVYSSFPPTAKPDSRGLVPGPGCIYPVEALTLADQVSAARMSWRGYIEDMADESGPHNCVAPQPDEPDEPQPGGYAARLNPFVYFHSLLDVGDCATNDMPLEQLSQDLGKPETTPEFAFVAPDLCQSGLAGQCPVGAPSGAAASDAFLAEWVPKILASKAIGREGLLVIAFNSLASPEAAAASGTGADPLKVGALLVSRYVTSGGTRDGQFTPYSMLRTIEELFALTPLGEAASKKTSPLGADLLGPQY